MSDSDKGCSRCGSRTGHGPVEAAECALWEAIVADVKAHAAALDSPPHVGEVADLLAHLNSRLDDKSRAHKVALVVLDLGWRPVIGAS